MASDPVTSVPDPNDAAPPERFRVCPECGSADCYRIPPYARYIFLGTIAVVIIFVVVGYSDLVIVPAMIGTFATMWFGRLSGRVRCRMCSRTWRPE